MDAGRQADLNYLDRAIRNPNTSEAVRRRAEETSYQIRHQQQFSTIQRGRAKLAEAAQAGEAGARKLADEADRMSRTFR